MALNHWTTIFAISYLATPVVAIVHIVGYLLGFWAATAAGLWITFLLIAVAMLSQPLAGTSEGPL